MCTRTCVCMCRHLRACVCGVCVQMHLCVWFLCVCVCVFKCISVSFAKGTSSFALGQCWRNVEVRHISIGSLFPKVQCNIFQPNSVFFRMLAVYWSLPDDQRWITSVHMHLHMHTDTDTCMFAHSLSHWLSYPLIYTLWAYRGFPTSGVSPLYIMLEIYHSGRELLICTRQKGRHAYTHMHTHKYAHLYAF